MELLYEASPDLDGAEDYVVSSKRMKLNPSGKPVLATSVRNLVAFSSVVDLQKGKNPEEPLATPTTAEFAGCRVYVADLNTPWEIFLVKCTQSSVTHLQWDHTGSKLLVGTEDGRVEIWGMVDNLLDKWGVNYEANFPGEPFLTSAWLAAPRRVTVNPDKLDSMNYSEKYSVNVAYSSRGFGGKPLDGCVLVSATGLVGVMINRPFDEGGKPVTGAEKILAVRSRVRFADVAYSSDGDILAITCGESMKHPVLVNKISVSLTGFDRAEIKVTAYNSLFLQPIPNHSISSVNFINKCNPDHLLLTFTNLSTGSSTLSIYDLVQQQLTLKSRFQTEGNETVSTNKWQQNCTTQLPSIPSCVGVMSLPLVSNGTSISSLPSQHAAVLTPLIAVALSNSNVVLLRTDNLQQMGTISTSPSEIPEKAAANRSKENEMVTALSFSWSGCLLLSLSAHSHLHAYKVHGASLEGGTATLLCELSMMGGLDPWDVFMSIRPGLIDNITDRLSETFARQPPPVQTHFNPRVLALKAALYRLASSGSARINDQQTLLVLYLVSGALKALLRPAELSSKEKGPAESLSGLLSSSGEQYADLNKVLMQMAAVEYAVEAGTLQSMQQFLQWCADLALKLLSTLPDLRHSRAPGWEICRDSKAVGTLRELIVLMRIWGLLRPSCLPTFRKTSESLDVLPLLFRLLTKLSIAPHDPDEGLIDECCLLPSEVQIPNHTAYCPTKSLGLASNILSSKGSPHQFHYGELPLKWWVGVETNGNWMDGLRLLWLGKNPSGVKICNRCGLTTLLSLIPRSTANKAWDQRWTRSCPCGGFWKVPSFIPQPKVQEVPGDFLNHL